MLPLQVCIEARIYSGKNGGVEQVIIGLANGLAQLDSSTESYKFLVYADSKDWLLPFLPDGAELIVVPPLVRAPQRSKWYLAARTKAANIVGSGRKMGIIPQKKYQPKQSDGTVEAAQIDVIHFPKQGAFLTPIPSIYHPHDLQHIHLPQYFPPQVAYKREEDYRTFCSQAHLVAVASRWVKNDVMQNYRLSSHKVGVVPLAPPIGAYKKVSESDMAAVAAAYQLPETFIFYPAQTWEHKNHIRLLEALAILREDFKLNVQFVSSGRKNDFYGKIKSRVRKLHLEQQVQFLGFVSPHELQCLYQLSSAVIIPTLFEAASFPLWEAFLSGRPAACSNVTSLPEQAGDAALVFDPYDPHDIASAINKLMVNAQLRKQLADKGRERVAQFTWERTARHFRAHYRRLGNRRLSEQDRFLLASADPDF